MERTILLVDDEENILRSLKRLLRRDGYNILTANGGQAGLDVLRENEVGVIISDQRMPEMTGVKFLSKVKELYPDTVRMVLSGYTDLTSVTDAINEGAIYKFLTKPWDDELLRENVANAFEYYELKEENRRLTQELYDANEELSIINSGLQNTVVKQESELERNVGVLQISQEIFENMPVAVLGVANDGMIVVANRAAHHWLAADGAGMVGGYVKEMLPPELDDLCNDTVQDDGNLVSTIELKGEKLDVRCSLMGKESEAKGWILVLTTRI
jgi:FixJ family two-component response regulator